MPDKPIIFSAPMIWALLDGRKTQTRRIIKINGHMPDFCGGRGDRDDPTCWGWEDPDHGDWVTLEKEPDQRMGWRDWRGAWRAGDRLWVKEAWRTATIHNHQRPSTLVAACREAGCERPWAPIHYETDGRTDNWFSDMTPGRYRHARFMPRWASRLTLTVTDVRVQRVQDISEADAVDEGADHRTERGKATMPILNARYQFQILWNILHGPDSWNENPWVAALTFDVRRCNIDQME